MVDQRKEGTNERRRKKGRREDKAGRLLGSWKIDSKGGVFQSRASTAPRSSVLHTGAQGQCLRHLFQKYVSPDTSAFRYAMRSAVRGKSSLFLSSPYLLNPPSS